MSFFAKWAGPGAPRIQNTTRRQGLEVRNCMLYRPKTPQDAFQEAFEKCSSFDVILASIFGRFSTPTWLPKSTKIDQKSMPRCLHMLTSFFDRFLIDFGSQLGPPNLEKSSPRCRESTIFQKIVFRKWHRCLIDLGANRASFWLPKSSQILKIRAPAAGRARFFKIWRSKLDLPDLEHLSPPLQVEHECSVSGSGSCSSEILKI